MNNRVVFIRIYCPFSHLNFFWSHIKTRNTKHQEFLQVPLFAERDCFLSCLKMKVLWRQRAGLLWRPELQVDLEPRSLIQTPDNWGTQSPKRGSDMGEVTYEGSSKTRRSHSLSVNSFTILVILFTEQLLSLLQLETMNRIDQWKITESPEIDSHKYDQLIFEKEANLVKWSKVFSTNCARVIGHPHEKKWI